MADPFCEHCCNCVYAGVVIATDEELDCISDPTRHCPIREGPHVTEYCLDLGHHAVFILGLYLSVCVPMSAMRLATDEL
jgi:hypothetical protein